MFDVIPRPDLYVDDGAREAHAYLCLSMLNKLEIRRDRHKLGLWTASWTMTYSLR